VVFGIENKGKGVSRVYGKVINRATSKELGDFIREKVKPDAIITTDGWLGYAPLQKEFMNLKMEKSEKKGKNFGQMHRVIMGFKGWLRGIHHHAEHLQSYIDEYTYRFNRNQMKENIFENLMVRMVKTKPVTYK
jgi:transposase-like protein